MPTPTVSTPTAPPDFNDSRSWELARGHTRSLGTVFPPLAAYIRILRTPAPAAPGARDIRLLALKSALRSPSIRTCLGYASISLFPGRLPSTDEVSEHDLVATLGCEGCASLIALLYIYRRIKPQVGEEVWEPLGRLVHERAEIGAHLGISFPDLGLARGLLLGGLRFLSLGVVAASDAQAYAGYLDWLKERHQPFDLAYEASRWGFTHPQICALLLQSLGFGAPFATAVTFALTPVTIQPDREPLAARIRAAGIWIESLALGGKAPALTPGSSFDMNPERLRTLLNRVAEVRHSGSTYLWLERGRVAAA